MPLVKKSTPNAADPQKDETLQQYRDGVMREAETAQDQIVDRETFGKIAMHAYVAAVTSPGVLSFSKDWKEFDANIEKYAQLIISKSLGL